MKPSTNQLLYSPVKTKGRSKKVAEQGVLGAVETPRAGVNMDTEIDIQVIRKLAEGKKKIVFVSGFFNILHPGHLRLLRFAAECGDFLVVGVYQDADNTQVPAYLRLEGVRAINWVDYAFTLTEPPERFISLLKPAIVVKGKEHEDQENPEGAPIKAYGGKLVFGSGDLSFSSVDLIKREFRDVEYSTIKKPMDFQKRHGFGPGDLVDAIRKFTALKICVIGDTIVDEYITGEALGMSQEDPTIVVQPVYQEKFIGGAAIVASHARSLGADVEFFSVVGKDATADFVREGLAKNGVKAHLFEDESRPTSLKQRYRANNKTLLRVSHLRQHDIPKDLVQQILKEVISVLKGQDLVIFSDFNYGMLPQALVDGMVQYCASENIKMVADSQSSSQIGDVSRFKGMSLMTPTEREARLATRDQNSGLVVLAESLRKQAKARNVVVTLGAEGILIHAESGRNKQITDKLPALNTAPRDVAGAGDSFLTAASMAMAVGCNIWMSSYLGSIAAACQVGRVGNIPIKAEELLKEVKD